MNTPSYLENYIKILETLPNYKFENWFKSLSWKGQLIVNGKKYFNIFFQGKKFDDGFVINKDNCPLIIYAMQPDLQEKIVLFDEKIHGYNPLLIEEKKFLCKEPLNELYIDQDGNSLFEVIIWTNTSIDFLDEFNFNKKGQIKLLNNKLVDLNYLQSNAFDAFGIILRKKDGKYIKLTEIELS